MNKEEMFALNTPESEILLELALIANNKFDSVLKLILQGYGIYPQVLNALVALGQSLLITPIMKAAGKHGNYPVEEMQKWMTAYYDCNCNWKQEVIEFRLQKIAEAFFSYEECIEAGFKVAPKGAKVSCWEKIAKSDGMDLVKSIYVQKANCLNQGSSAEDKNEVKELEYYLAEKGEYEFLYNRGCWRGLSHTLGGVQYIAETRHYMNGLASCLLGYYLDMDQETLDYCIATLDKAQLDDNYRPLYAEWKERRS